MNDKPFANRLGYWIGTFAVTLAFAVGSAVIVGAAVLAFRFVTTGMVCG